MHGGLLESCSTDVRKSESSIVNKTLLQSNSVDISEYTITEQKDKEYKESSVTKEVTSYFNIFECGRNLLDRLDVTYQRAFMATPKDKYYNRFLDTLINENNHKGTPLSNDNLQQAVSILLEETEA